MINLEESKELRKKYTLQLKETQLLARKVMLNYYETQLQQKHKTLQCSQNTAQNSYSNIKIPKIEISYRNYSELKQSIICKSTFVDHDCSWERFIQFKQIVLLKQITNQLRQTATVLRFVLNRLHTHKAKAFDGFILNYNRNVRKQSYQRVVNNFRALKAYDSLQTIFSHWKKAFLTFKAKNNILQQILFRQAIKIWRQQTKKSLLLVKSFQQWKQYVLNKKCKRIYRERRIWQCFIFWKFKCSKNQIKVKQIIEAKDHYATTLKLKVYNAFRQNINLQQKEREFQVHFNEFLPKNIKL